MIVALVAVVAVAVAALAAQLRLAAAHARHTDALLARQDAERHGWARERWELNTRIQSPELARMAPPPPPTAASAPTDDQPEADEFDESHLVGMVVDPSDRGEA